MGRRPFYAKGSLANRPDARRPGLFWHDSDTDKVYVDDGQAWQEAGGAQLQQSERLLSYNLFVPGTLRPLTIATLKNPSLSDTAILRYLEANLQSAPVGVDGTDHIAARVAGSGGGSADLPLSSAVSRFALDNATPTDQYVRDSQNYFRQLHVWGFRFRPSATKTISVATIKPFDGSWTGVNRYIVIQDASRVELVRSDVYNFAVSARAWADHVLQGTATLEANQDYWFWLVFPDGPGTADLYTGSDVSGGSQTGVVDGSWTGQCYLSSNAAHDENTALTSLTQSTEAGPHFRLKGTPQGTSLTGDSFTFSLVGAGIVPPDPGADLNLTMRLEV